MSEPPKPVKTFLGAVTIPIFYVATICVVAALFFALDHPIYTFVQTTPSAQVHPLGPGQAGDAGLAVLYLGAIAAATFGLGFFVRRKIRRRASVAVAVLFGVMGVSSTVITFWFLPVWIAESIAVVMYVFFALAVAKKLPVWATLPYVTFIGTSAGIIFVVTLPTTFVVVLLALFACWDIYAVFKGPLKKIVENMPSQMLVMMTANIGQAKLGLGDVFLYSMTIGLANAIGGVGSGMAYWVSLSIVAGFAITAFIIQQGMAKILPALPLPIFLSLFTLAVFLR